jgi:hypothetical protein
MRSPSCRSRKYNVVPLTPLEDALLDIAELQDKLNRKPRRGRPFDDSVWWRNLAIVHYVRLLEADGWKPEAAVARAETVYGVSGRRHRDRQ